MGRRGLPGLENGVNRSVLEQEGLGAATEEIERSRRSRCPNGEVLRVERDAVDPSLGRKYT